MVFERLFGKKPAAPVRRYAVVRSGKVFRYDNPLPQLFPDLYNLPPRDGFCRQGEVRNDLRRFGQELLGACHLPVDTVLKLLEEDFEPILDVPAVYELFLFLKGQGLERFYANNLALITVLDACAFYGTSEKANDLRELLLPCSLAVCLRHYGVNFLTKNDRQALAADRHYNLTDARQKQLRDDFLDLYRQVADRMAQLSADRFRSLLGEAKTCPRETLTAVLHILRYSTRLMGRTATELKEKELERVHGLACYIAELYNFASAWAALRKRPCLVLAEEWGRSRVFSRHKQIQASARHDMHALSDLFRVCRCEVLSNFQSSGRDAIYSIPDQLLVKEVPGEGPAGPGGPLMRWRCFHPSRPLSHRARSLSECLIETYRTGGDPSDAELTPAE